jgi:hypothetical protein
MNSIFEGLADLQSPEAARTLSRELGTDEAATQNALAAALPALLGALSRSGTSPDGARSLLVALDRDHDGSVLDDLLGALGGKRSGSAEEILGHLLGARRGAVESQIGRQSGLDPASVGKILAAVAPLVMGALGRARRQGNWDADGLSRELGAERARAEEAVPGSFGIFEKLLDADGDGEIGDDVTRVGTQLIASLFRR